MHIAKRKKSVFEGYIHLILTIWTFWMMQNCGDSSKIARRLERQLTGYFYRGLGSVPNTNIRQL